MPNAKDRVRHWSDALREVEVLEPWLTESNWDEHYWDDVASYVVSDARSERGPSEARAAPADALRSAFPSVDVASDNGLYRDRLDDRLDAIVRRATAD